MARLCDWCGKKEATRIAWDWDICNACFFELQMDENIRTSVGIRREDLYVDARDNDDFDDPDYGF